MMEKKWLGNKTKEGFYKKTKDAKGKKGKLALDFKTMEYVPANKPKFASVGAAKKTEEGVEKTVKVMFNGKDVAAEVTREYLCNNFIYAANRIPEICDTIVGIDNAMKWGYNHQLGPFETWDAVGVQGGRRGHEEAEEEGPQEDRGDAEEGLRVLLRRRRKTALLLRLREEGLCEAGGDPEIILLPALKERNKIIKQNAGSSLVDIGDGVACLEFHTKMNAVDEEMIEMIFLSLRHRGEGFRGLVVGNQRRNFSAGANIFKVLVAIQKGDWDILEKMIADFQKANMRMKYLRKARGERTGRPGPGRRLRDCHARGQVPALRRDLHRPRRGRRGRHPGRRRLQGADGPRDGRHSRRRHRAGMNLQRLLREGLREHRHGQGGHERRRGDGTRLHPQDGKHQPRTAISSSGMPSRSSWGSAKFYKKPKPALIPVMGENFRGMAEAVLYNMRHGNFATDYDVHVARKVAHILSGGDCAEGTW